LESDTAPQSLESRSVQTRDTSSVSAQMVRSYAGLSLTGRRSLDIDRLMYINLERHHEEDQIENGLSRLMLIIDTVEWWSHLQCSAPNL
jgi:hypothetical protein